MARRYLRPLSVVYLLVQLLRLLQVRDGPPTLLHLVNKHGVVSRQTLDHVLVRLRGIHRLPEQEQVVLRLSLVGPQSIQLALLGVQSRKQCLVVHATGIQQPQGFPQSVVLGLQRLDTDIAAAATPICLCAPSSSSSGAIATLYGRSAEKSFLQVDLYLQVPLLQ